MKSQYLYTVLALFSFTKVMNAETENNTDELETQNFATNITSRLAGQIRFEDDRKFSSQYSDDSGHITFEAQPSQSLMFEENKADQNPGGIKFQDDNRIQNSGIKKKRKRRKPRQRPYLNAPGPLPLGQGPYPYPGFPHPQYPAVIPIGANPGGQYHRPPRRPKPSFASEALSTVTGALSSIALYDDYQCVPRLLCEAAGGGAQGSSSILQSVTGLQPLLTLLSAYGGVSSSPLFVFGRAVFLGMTSKGNTASCRYAYSQCPTDPEQLVHYLNNHNGGFFRFFNAPQSQNPQNLEQFYNQLSIPGQYPNQQNQNYGLYNPNQPQNYGLYPQQNQYGLHNPNVEPQNPTPQNYGLYNQEYPNQQNLYNQQFENYGQSPHYYNGNGFPQNYGQKYSYQDKHGFNKLRFKDKSSSSNRIEKRIQNRPNPVDDDNVDDTGSNVKWTFPDSFNIKYEDIFANVRDNNWNFPEENSKTYLSTNKKITELENTRKPKAVFFPGDQNDKYVNNYVPNTGNDIYRNEYQNMNVDFNPLSNSIKLNNYYNNIRQHINNNNENNDEDGIRTVYIVRGNGNPNNPEIIKLRPGQKVL